MRRLARLLILLTLSAAPGVSGCTNFTLVGSVNLGGDPLALGNQDSEVGAEPAKDDVATVCIPRRSKDVNVEFRAHGYVTGREAEWKNTRLWFEAIGKIPTCP